METISEREEAVRPGTKRKAAEVTDDEEGGGGGHRWMRRKAGGGGVAIYTLGRRRRRKTRGGARDFFLGIKMPGRYPILSPGKGGGRRRKCGNVNVRKNRKGFFSGGLYILPDNLVQPAMENIKLLNK